MRRLFAAGLVMASLAGFGVAHADADDAAVVRGLEAQYQAALIRERRLADDREQRLIADAEARLSRARAAADAAQGEAAQVQAELAAARADYAALVESIAQRDGAARAEIEHIAARLRIWSRAPALRCARRWSALPTGTASAPGP